MLEMKKLALALSLIVLATFGAWQAIQASPRGGVYTIRLAPPSQSLRAQIEAMNKVAAKSILHKDLNAFSKAIKPTVAPDFKYMENGTSQNFDQMVDHMKQGVGMMTKVTLAQAKILKLSQKGDAGRCSTVHIIEGTMVGPDKKSHKLHVEGTSSDVYAKVGSKWLLKTMTFQNGKALMDGKPFNPGGPGK